METYHSDVIGFFIWDIQETSMRRMGRRGHVPVRRLGEVPLRRHWVFQLTLYSNTEAFL